MRFNVSKPKVKENELTGLEWDDEFTKGLTNADALKQAAARRGVGIKRSDDGKHWILTGNKNFTNGT
jgi:alkylation response protein AidB-like acyl-CoA dehydrogenase